MSEAFVCESIRRELDVSAAEAEFLFSALTVRTNKMSLAEFASWFEGQKKRQYRVEPIPWSHVKGWSFEEDTEDLVHRTGKFFRISGISIRTNVGPVKEWDQPVIVQPEVGVLGILAKKFDGCLHFLMQAKMEPGNVGSIQLSPTLQATKSNFTQVHGGAKPRFVEYFNGEKKTLVLADQLQSEQGSRFLRKRNRNVIVEVPENEDLPSYPDFCWLTLGQLRELMKLDNVVNMDTRSVLSGVHYISRRAEAFTADRLQKLFTPSMKSGSAETGPDWDMMTSALTMDACHSRMTEIRSWFTRLKMQDELRVRSIPLKSVRGWYRDENQIAHESGRFFKVIGVSVEAKDREVGSWCQPLVQQMAPGIVGFLMTKINGINHFLVQARLEPGNFDVVEMAPTVQMLVDSYADGPVEELTPYLDLFLNPPAGSIRYDRMQSEEGGRFYHMVNRNMVVEIPSSDAIGKPNGRYMWMSLGQISELIKYNNCFNIEARSLVACIGL